MLSWICTVIDHRRPQCVRKISDMATPHVPLFCSYLVLMSCFVYYRTEARQHGIHFYINTVASCRFGTGLLVLPCSLFFDEGIF